MTAPLLAEAQSPPPRVPSTLNPGVSATTRLPAGVDSGTPASGEGIPLGTPVPPSPTVRPGTPGVGSAAARAAARRSALGGRAGAGNRRGYVPAGPAPLSGATPPLHPEATLTVPERRHIADGGPRRDASALPSTARRACSNEELSVRTSIASCTRLLDRSARSGCVSRAMGGRDGKPMGLLPDCS